MLISYNWLRELTATTLPPQELRERLTNVGLAVDAVEERDGDYVLDVEVPSNRGDCLSHVGIARELAVIEMSRISDLKSEIRNSQGKTGDFASVEIRDPDLCPRYAARIVRSVRIAPSPEWLRKRLEVLGQRPINNVADITNYVLHELGQPLHAFDLAKLTENRIIVRRAEKDETIATLDGVERNLDKEMLVIADASRPVAVAGVMGGEDSEISNTTTDVLIESAYFNAASVRRTAKLLGLHTEASHRFERGTDPGGVLQAQKRCVALICEIAGGAATEDALDIYPSRKNEKVVSLRPDRVEAITSLKVSSVEMVRILKSLGFDLSDDASGKLTFTVPSWRHDVAIEEDLIEEVARHTGFGRIGTELPPSSLSGEYHSTERSKRALRRSLSALGFDEAINLSFIELSNDFELIPEFGGPGEENLVTLTNPIIEEASRMRQTLLPGLLNSVRNNINHGIRDVCLFELGRLFAANEPGELPREREALALVSTGGIVKANQAQAEREIDFFDLKGAFEAGVAAMNLPPLDSASAEVTHLQAGQAAGISFKGVRVGSIGRLAETIAAQYKFRQPIFVAEVDLTAFLETEELPVLYSPLPRFPSILRDVSLLVDRKITVAELLRAVHDQKVEHFVGAKFVGTYEGEGIPEGERSVTLRFEYRADDRTLRDEEVDEIHWRLVKALQEKFSAEVR
ncbi:MAG TPA: phenylalanine--tRNA ligase subunit beta [Pyrinomonadaceae bacterium]|nr:phenylalanine--tRNA ligase subunit beta [Pyrinomonadaceae bacterium]